MFRGALRLPGAKLALLCLLAFVLPARAESGGSLPGAPAANGTERSDTGSSLASKRPKVGLALGGGGTRGVAHVGVLKVLTEEGVPIDFVAGTSIGAIVGGLYCAGVPLDTIEEKLLNRSLMKSFFTVPLTVRLALAPVLLLPRALGHHPYDGLYTGNKFRNFLNKSTPGCDKNIEDFEKPFRAVALNLVDGKAYAITTGNLGYALQASSAVPGLRKPVQIGDRLFVDGGVVNNLPVDQVRNMGADLVIAVDVDERFEPVPLDTFRAMGSVSRRLLNLQLNSVDAPQLEKADLVIHPDVDGIGLLSTKVRDARRALEAGVRAARGAMPEIRSKMPWLPASSPGDAAVPAADAAEAPAAAGAPALPALRSSKD